MTQFTARRVAPGVDIWNMFADGHEIGSLTRFPGEGPMATVSFGAGRTTVAAATLHSTLRLAKDAYFELVEEFESEHIEDEDGTTAHMRMLERRAEDSVAQDDEMGSYFGWR